MLPTRLSLQFGDRSTKWTWPPLIQCHCAYFLMMTSLKVSHERCSATDPQNDLQDASSTFCCQSSAEDTRNQRASQARHDGSWSALGDVRRQKHFCSNKRQESSWHRVFFTREAARLLSPLCHCRLDDSLPLTWLFLFTFYALASLWELKVSLLKRIFMLLYTNKCIDNIEINTSCTSYLWCLFSLFFHISFI